MLFKAGTERKLNQVIEMQALLEARHEKHFIMLYNQNKRLLSSIGMCIIYLKLLESGNKKVKIIQNAFDKVSHEISNASTLSDNDVNENFDKHFDNAKRVDDDDVPIQIDIHRMAHHSMVNSIQMVYKEWFQGWDVRPSVTELFKSGYKWRSPMDKKVFSRRRKSRN